MIPTLLIRDPLTSQDPAKPANVEPSHVLITILSAIPLLLYTFILIRRFDTRVGAGGFDYTTPLKRWELVAFPAVYTIEFLVLFLTASCIIQWVTRKWKHKLTWLSSFPVMAAYFIYVTVKFRIMRSLKDGIDVVVLRSLGGGSVFGALSFVRDALREELLSLLPLIMISLLLGAGGCWLLKRYGRSAAIWLDAQSLVRTVLGTRGLILANTALIILAPLIAVGSSSLQNALSAYLPHAVYSGPAVYLTDFDGDGYGLMDSPPDFAPFDSTRRPYAIEIPGDGIDQDGVGGDLPVAVFRAPMGTWDGKLLEGKNVLLIVLESARAELLLASFKGSPVMPTLQKLPGQTLNMVSNAGRTGPSVSGMFAGTLSEFESGISLVDRFKNLNYRTAIISAQDESFGDIELHAHMNHADLFVDSTGFPLNMRMFADGPVSSDLITTKFAQWLRTTDAGKPFFAYLNIQEMHFPYHYRRVHPELTTRLIPIRAMVPENKEWLRETYFDAARRADRAISKVISSLDELHLREDTVILVVGDHGEELFDNGYLGHGVSLSYDSYATLGKLVNSQWKTPAGPVGVSDVSTVFYNSLLRDLNTALPVDPEVLCYVGNADKPPQIGLASQAGLIRYDFKENTWTRQAHWGAPVLPVKPDNHVIHVWESYVIKRIKEAGGADKPLRGNAR